MRAKRLGRALFCLWLSTNNKEKRRREKDAGMPEIVAPPPAATQTILSGIPSNKWISTKRHEILVCTAKAQLSGHLSTKSMLTFHVKQNFIMRHEKKTMLKSLDPATHFSYNWFSIFWIRELWTCQGYMKAELCLNGVSSGPIDMLFKSCEHTPTFQVRKSHFPFYIPLDVKRLKGRQEVVQNIHKDPHQGVRITNSIARSFSKAQSLRILT